MSIDKEDFKVKIKTDNYVCSICGKRNVKLWRPYIGTEPLICAECAEKRQTPREYEKISWSSAEPSRCTGEFTGKKRRLPKWKVNENGKIPTELGPGPDGKPLTMTNKLSINISDVSTAYSPGSTLMVPAYPDEGGEFSSVPLGICEWWDALPTR